MSWSNFLAWMAQVALVAAAGSLAPYLFRLRRPAARLVYFQALLVICLALPLLQPWQRSFAVLRAQGPVARVAAGAPAVPAAPLPRRWGLEEAALALLAGGAIVRAAWFALGFARLRRYRRASRELAPLPELIDRLRRELLVFPELRVSSDVAGPVTFGVRRPVVLFPPDFPCLAPELQVAVACHELLHVRRRDWVFTVAEECVRVVFWFHPAVWWLLGQTQLAREQAVDGEVVRLTEARERYVEALLALSGAARQLDLAPAPLFLRGRHLVARVAAIIHEVPMSKRTFYCSMLACFATLAVAGWIAVGALPLRAAPQEVNDAPGVSVTASERLLHRAPVEYPAAALEKRIAGPVMLEVQLAPDGTVADATVLSGPVELRRAALQSVLQWHFEKGTPARVPVTVQFTLPDPATTAVTRVGTGPDRTGKLRGLEIRGLSPEAAAQLKTQLGLETGQEIDPAVLARIRRTLREFDPHLDMLAQPVSGGDDLLLHIFVASGGGMEKVVKVMPRGGVPGGVVGGIVGGVPAMPSRIRVGANVQAAKLLRSVAPQYPPLAKQARVQGVVKLQIVVGPEGRVNSVQAEGGHPLLVPAAMEAARQYEYSPTLLNGKPVEVVTTVDVNFTLP